MSEIWSNTDFPYMCLKDEVRTTAFREAIRTVVLKPAGRRPRPCRRGRGGRRRPAARGVSRASLRWRYRMRAGLGAPELACVPVTASTRGCGRLAR